jgi:hypothetical protein
VEVDLASGTARMSVKNLKLQDFFTIPNAFLHVQDPVSTPAKCAFDIHWSGPVTSQGPVTSPPGSSGQLIRNQATMTWSASNHLGFRYESNPSGTTSAFAQLGQVQNGVFA